MERVDAIEIEPAILEVARQAAPVNRDVLSNPRVHIEIGDAREVLLTTPRRYDVMFSEPSNPYRAGIANLFTREYYQAAASRLTEAGVFAQWLQGYEVDNSTVSTPRSLPSFPRWRRGGSTPGTCSWSPPPIPWATT
jgi:spermidine synthase